MSLHLPNTFGCVSRTLVFAADEPVDFAPVAQAGLPAELADQLRARRFLVTLSTVTSTSSGDRSFSFLETLLKVPVVIDGEPFLFPVAGYVNHEYSLVRGYLLGFNKYVDTGSAAFRLSRPGFELAADGPAGGEVPDAQVVAEQSLPLLLWSDYAVGNASSHGFGRLVVKDYVRQPVRRLEGVGVQTVLERRLQPVEAYEVLDTFVVADVSSL